MSFLACEDTIAEIYPENPVTPGEVDTHPVLEVTNSKAFPSQRQGTKPFFYEVEKISCTVQGYTLKVLISQPNNYQYAWIIDEIPAGNTNQIHCVTGQKVYLTLTRYADSMTVSKYFELPPTNHEQAVDNDETAN